MSIKINFPATDVIPFHKIKENECFSLVDRRCCGIRPSSHPHVGDGLWPAVLFFGDGAVCTVGLDKNTPVRRISGVEVIFS